MSGHAFRRALFLVMVLGLAVAACATVIGIDDYQERMDAGTDAKTSPADVVVSDGGHLESGLDAGSKDAADGG